MHPLECVLSDGFGVWKNKLKDLSTPLYNLIQDIPLIEGPARGHDKQGNYYATDVGDVEWGNYWTHSLIEYPLIQELQTVLKPIIKSIMMQPILYHADISVLTPECSFIRPHVDTPHRHKPYNHRVKVNLGVQVGIPLSSNTISAGTTAFLPKSQHRVWDIEKCYKGEYTAEFLKDAVQPEINFGDVLVWDARTLHSQMPNITESKRYMLLLNYVEETIVPGLMKYESSLIS